MDILNKINKLRLSGLECELNDTHGRLTLKIDRVRNNIYGTIALPEGIEAIEVNTRDENTISHLKLPNTMRVINRDTLNNIDYLHIDKITIADSCTEIGTSTFGFCDIRSVELPNTITKIGDGAFVSCDLREIVIPNSCIEIGDRAFEASSISSVILSSKLNKIGDGAFVDCGLREIAIPDGCNEIGEGAFSCNCYLQKVKINGKIQILRSGLFNACRNLTSIELPDSIEKIESYAFSGSGLRRVTIPKYCNSIGERAFYLTNITDIEIPKECSNIHGRALEGCHKLKRIKIPKRLINKGFLSLLGDTVVVETY